MGKRGPGAKPTKTLPKRRDKPEWERANLLPSERVIAFIETLKVTSGPLAGQNMIVRVWQDEFIRAVYDPQTDDGARIVKTAVFSCARKNGKTGLASALALAHLVGPMAEPRGQVVSCAVDRKQAAIIFDEMSAMIIADEFLAARLNIMRTLKRVEDAETGSTYVALSADYRSQHGLSPSFLIYDEAAQSRDRRLWDTVSTGGGARAEPLKMIISTQAPDDAHWFSHLIDYGLAINEGRIDDPRFVLRLYAAPTDADPFSREAWARSNPALGDFRSVADMEELAERARRLPAFEGGFRNLNLNQRIAAEERFIPAALWDKCGATVDPRELAGRECYGALDLGSTQDLTALVLVFPDGAGGFDVLAFFWCPKDTLYEREERGNVPYPAWSKLGHIEPTPGKATDYAFVVHRLGELAGKFKIKALAYDRWRIEDFKRALANEGIDVPLEPWGQGFKDMSPAIDQLETLTLAGKLRHPRNPVLSWCVSNCVVSRDPAGNRKLDKEKAREKIDGAVALAMALGLAARKPESAPEPRYQMLVFGR